MNFELSGEIIKILDDLAKRFGVAIDWTSENVVPYVMELLKKFIKYNIVENVISLVVMAGFIFIGFIFFKNLYKYYKLAKNTDEPNLFFNVDKFTYSPNLYPPNAFGFCGIVVVGIVMLVSILLLPSIISELLKLAIIPELYIIEYFM